MNVKEQSTMRFGAYCCFLVGALYSLIVCCAFFSPDSIASYVTSHQYFKDFEFYRPIFVTLKWLMLAVNMAMVGVVCAFYELRRDRSHGFMTWVSLIAIIGLGVGMYQSVIDISMVPYLADQYAAGSDMIKELIIVLGVANPMIYILSLGFPGLWFITISWRALSNPSIPKHLVYLGFLWGWGNVLTVIAHAFVILPLIKLVSFGALLAAPLWSVSEGLFLYRCAKKS